MSSLTPEETRVVIFAIRSDLETLTKMIESSDATVENKQECYNLCKALIKLEDDLDKLD